jgi:hypothetical protein
MRGTTGRVGHGEHEHLRTVLRHAGRACRQGGEERWRLRRILRKHTEPVLGEQTIEAGENVDEGVSNPKRQRRRQADDRHLDLIIGRTREVQVEAVVSTAGEVAGLRIHRSSDLSDDDRGHPLRYVGHSPDGVK